MPLWISLDFWGVWKITSWLIRAVIGGVVARIGSLGTAGKVPSLRIASGSLIIADLFISYIPIFLNPNLKFLELTPSRNTS